MTAPIVPGGGVQMMVRVDPATKERLRLLAEALQRDRERDPQIGVRPVVTSAELVREAIRRLLEAEEPKVRTPKKRGRR